MNAGLAHNSLTTQDITRSRETPRCPGDLRGSIDIHVKPRFAQCDGTLWYTRLLCTLSSVLHISSGAVLKLTQQGTVVEEEGNAHLHSDGGPSLGFRPGCCGARWGLAPTLAAAMLPGHVTLFRDARQTFAKCQVSPQLKHVRDEGMREALRHGLVVGHNLWDLGDNDVRPRYGKPDRSGKRPRSRLGHVPDQCPRIHWSGSFSELPRMKWLLVEAHAV